MEWSERQDWDALKDEFEERSHKGHYGRPFVHSTVEAFARFMAKNEDIERWIIKSIGPTPMREIEWKGDWAVDRAVKRVKDMLHAQQLQEKLSQDTGLMKVAAPVAASYRTWMEEPERMRDAVIGYLGGTILESKPKKWDRMTLKLKKKWRERQEHRLDFYATWLERILVYKAKVDNHYLGTLGYNKPNYYSVMQNLILFAVFACRPLGGLGLAALVLMRVALRAATPITFIPGAGLLDVACALIPAALGVHHG